MSLDIVQISTYPPAHCGIATYTAQLSSALRELGHNVTVLAEVVDLGPTQSDGCFRIWQRKNAYFSMKGLAAIGQAIDSSSKKPDVVHIQHEFGLFSTPDIQQLLEGLQERKIPVVMTLHTVMGEPYRHDFFTMGYDVQYIVHTRAAHLVAKGRRLTHVTTIPHGAMRRRIDRPHEMLLHGLCPGFISPSKGHYEIIQAIAGTMHKLTIVGECRDEIYGVRLEQAIRDFGLEQTQLRPSVQLINGWKTDSEMHRYFSDADFVVLGNDVKIPFYSASGQAATALGYGLPIFAKDAPIYREVPGVVIYRNTDELTQLLRGLAAWRPTTELPEDHTWPLVAHQHVAVYRAVVD